MNLRITFGPNKFRGIDFQAAEKTRGIFWNHVDLCRLSSPFHDICQTELALKGKNLSKFLENERKS